MTQTISSNKFCPALNLFLFTLRKNSGFTAIATILTLILSPFYLLMQIGEMDERFVTNLLDFKQIFVVPAFLIAIGACGFFAILLYINFGFLYSKVSADAYNSMPISRVGLLISRFFACVISALIPLVAGYIGFFICANMENVSADMGYILQCFGFSALMLLLCGTFVFIFVIAGGTVLDSIISLAAASIGIPLITILIFGMCEDNLYGCVSVDYTMVRFISPFAFAIIRFSEFVNNPKWNTLLDGTTVTCVLALTLLFFVISLLLFKKRKAEAAGSAFAWKFAPFIIGFVVSFVCYFIMGAIFANDRLSIGFWVSGACGIVIGAVLYNLVTNRGFKKIKETVSVILITALGVVCMNAAIGLDVFGFETYIPAEKDIESIEVVYRGMVLDIENQKLITGLHKKIINDRPDSDYSNGNEYISITYTLKNNSRVARYYFLPTDFAKAYKTAIVNHEITAQLKRNFDNFAGKEFSLAGFYGDGNRWTVKLSRQEAEKLVKAYVLDLQSVSHNDLFGDKYNESDRIEISAYHVSDTQNKQDEVRMSTFSFAFRDYEAYKNFQEEFSLIDINARNIYKNEYEK